MNDQPQDQEWRLATDTPPGIRGLPKQGSVRDLQTKGDYDPDKQLVAALNTALLLGQPLLLAGEPGVGKSEFARWVNERICGEQTALLRFDVKSTTTARELFYQIDNIERFHRAHEKRNSYGVADIDPLTFIRFNALGEAIIRANDPETSFIKPVAARLKGGVHKEAERRVVLIDEIDKAPRDVPNDLLREIEECTFSIAELGHKEITAADHLRPVVIMTSNAERSLPAPFLRRCVFFHIDPPDKARLTRIVRSRLARDYPEHSPLIEDAIKVYEFVRGITQDKKPSVAELLAFILALRGKDYALDHRLQGREDWQEEANVLLLKTTQDQRSVRNSFADIAWD